MPWKVVAASAAGSAHQSAGTPCQDAFAWFCRDGWLVAVVCDGAGSARFADVGAQHAAHALCRQLTSAIPAAENNRDDRGWGSRIESAIEAARIALKGAHVGEEASMNDFHATIVGAVIGPRFGTFFQIGDGVGVGVRGSQWNDSVIALPENGEYADETFFYTEDHWREHLRFTPIPADVSLIVLMTDGAMSFVMAPGGASVDPGFFGPVTRYLDSVDADTGSRALYATLDDARTHAITTDDKTLLWARRRA